MRDAKHPCEPGDGEEEGEGEEKKKHKKWRK